DRHTGYVNLSGSGYSGVILLNDGQALQALSTNGTAVQGEAAFLQIRRHMDAGDGVIDVIELECDTVTALAQLFTSPYLYSWLLGRFVNLEALLEYLAEEHVSGGGGAPLRAGVLHHPTTDLPLDPESRSRPRPGPRSKHCALRPVGRHRIRQ